MRLLRFLAALLAVMAAAAPTLARDRLVVALQLEPPGLDPSSGAAAPTDDVTYHTIFEGLTTQDTAGVAHPLLATGWQVAADGRSYLFALRRGVRFADGTPFDAGAAAFSLRRAIAPASTNALKERLADIAGIDVLGPYLIRIRLSAADAELPALLAWGDLAMVAPRAAGTLATAPVGTGPFRLAEWRRGDRITLVGNDLYWGARPPLARIDFRFIADPAAAYAAASGHAIDLFPAYPAPENLARLRRDPALRVTVGPSEAEVILALNEARGPLADLRVRRVISYALDRRAIINGAMAGYGVPIGSHFPPGRPDYLDLTGRYPHDPARARALLAAAGYPDGVALTLTLPPPSYARRSGEIVAAQLAAIGVRVTLVPVDWPQWLDQVFTRHAYDMSIVAHVEPADYDLYGRRDYYFGYDGTAVRALLARLRATADRGERHRLLGAIQQRIADDAVNGFLFEVPRLSVADARLRDLWIDTPLQAIDYARARFVGAGANGGAADLAGRSLPWPALMLVATLAAAALAGRTMGWRWLAARALVFLLTLAAASLLIFALLQLAPGDPAQFIAGIGARPAQVAALRRELGLTGSAPLRYARWLAGLLTGDFGTSAVYRVPVAGLIEERLGVSLPLAGLALAIAVPLGVGSALLFARGDRAGRLGAGAAALVAAVPDFWLAMLLLAIATAGFGWAAAGIWPGWDDAPAAFGALLLPALALALPQAAILHRVTRAALLAERARDYVLFGRARGLSEAALLWRQMLPNLWPPVLALVGLQLPFLLGGAVLVENVFALPGLGRLALQATGARDLPVVQAVAMLLVATTVGASLLADVGHALVDPRVRGRR